jgi:hypothetical protein
MIKTYKSKIDKNDIKKLINSINYYDALSILKTIADEYPNIAARIEQLALTYLSDVDIEEVTDQVYSELNFIDVEDVWDRSGSTRDGYVDPSEAAYDIFEETLIPFIEELDKYHKLTMTNEEKYYCMGILKGIYKFDKESKSEYREWSNDVAGEYFDVVLNKWKNNCNIPKNLKEMEDFIKENFPNWV